MRFCGLASMLIDMSQVSDSGRVQGYGDRKPAYKFWIHDQEGAKTARQAEFRRTKR